MSNTSANWLAQQIAAAKMTLPRICPACNKMSTMRLDECDVAEVIYIHSEGGIHDEETSRCRVKYRDLPSEE